MKAVLHIEGFIGEVYDFFGDVKKFTLSDLNVFIANLPSDTSEITVEINSGGGYINDGFAIHDRLATLDIPVSTEVLGMCGSIATVIAQAPKTQGKGGKRRMHANSEYFIHNPAWSPESPEGLEADEVQRIADELKRNEDKIVNFYVDLTGQKKAEIRNRMDESTTLSAIEAKKFGFIDEVIEARVVALTKYKLVALSPKKTNMEAKEVNTLFEAITKGFDGIRKMLNNTATVMKTVLADGTTVYHTEALTAGVKVFTDEALTTAYVGSFEVNGETVNVEAGAVKEVVKPQAAPDAKDAEIQKLKEELEKLEAEKLSAETKATEAETKQDELKTEVEKIQGEFTNLKNKLVTGGFQNFVTGGVEKAAPVAKSGLDEVAEKMKAAMKAKKY